MCSHLHLESKKKTDQLVGFWMLDPSHDGHIYQYSKTDARRCINFIVIHNLYTLASNCLSHIIKEGRKQNVSIVLITIYIFYCLAQWVRIVIKMSFGILVLLRQGLNKNCLPQLCLMIPSNPQHYVLARSCPSCT